MQSRYVELTKGMNLFKGVEKGDLLKLQSSISFTLPEDFISFLKFSNGAIGMIGIHYLILYKAEEIASYNVDYSVEEFAPGLLLFGSDGGDEGYGFDYRGNRLVVVDIPFVGMDWPLARKKGDTFLDFLTKLNKK